jgi:hypothetical protein
MPYDVVIYMAGAIAFTASLIWALWRKSQQ